MSHPETLSTATAPRRNFVYFADPMCSWCYGFAPVITTLVEHFADRLGFRIVMGGLRPGNRLEMRPKDREYLRDTWLRVAESSGQPFDLSFLERERFVYDTEPACRAVVAARANGDLAALTMMEAISSAFYAQNFDVTRDDVLIEIAWTLGHDRSAFAELLASDVVRNATVQDFVFAKQSGVEGFPCLVAGDEVGGYQLVTHGFRPIDGLPEAIERWLDATPARAT
jgi:putative protein-disulfide isomerase